MKTFWVRNFLAVFAVLQCGVAASGELITIRFTGRVTGITDKEDSYTYDQFIHVGDLFEGTYSYDSEAHNSSSVSGEGLYASGSPAEIRLTLGGFTFRTVASHPNYLRITVRDDFSEAPYDQYIVESPRNEPLSTGLAVHTIKWELKGGTAPLSSAALPLTAPDPEAWSYNVLSIGCGGLPEVPYTLIIKGQITDAELVVPEPGTVLLLAFRAAVFCRRR